MIPYWKILYIMRRSEKSHWSLFGFRHGDTGKLVLVFTERFHCFESPAASKKFGLNGGVKGYAFGWN